MALITSQCQATITTVYFQNFSITQIETLYSLSNNSSFSFPPTPGNLQSTFCMSACSKYFMYMKSYNICPFMTGLFYLFQGSCTLQHVSVLPFFWLNSMLLLGIYYIFFIHNHMLMGTWVVTTITVNNTVVNISL